MVGTPEGGKKAAKTNKERNGADFYKRIGKKGGQNGHTGGFATSHEWAVECGKKGGKASRRGPNKAKGEKPKRVNYIKTKMEVSPEPKKRSGFLGLFKKGKK